jgi:hypothetical protein
MSRGSFDIFTEAEVSLELINLNFIGMGFG